MQVEISKDVIKNPSLLEEVYDQLLAFKKKHKIGYQSYLLIENDPVLSPDFKEAFRALFTITDSLITFKKTITVVARKPKDNNEVSVRDLNNILSQKAFIVVENEIYDKNFINILLGSSNRGPNLNKLENILWGIRGPGGCGGIPNLIKKCSVEQFGVNRILVVYDSDKFHPDYSVPKPQSNIEAQALTSGADYVMLQKREIENYIPISVLRKIFGSEESKVKAFSSWSKIQRDFFDLKSGFHSDCRSNDKRYSNLYRNLTSSDVNLFKNMGFGEDIASKAFDSKYQSEYHSRKLEIIDPEIIQEFDNVKQKLLHIL
ncbi:hypothetical protein BCU98_14520 [Vibrio splendidus]|uniref:hypothetical protein n=1 Tax=Vibrio splendidus TaxID=29497 RepID=UPI000C864D4C|nr:hypothetical protein [Vibrio splendidus]PMG16321.1 hypothetical protein BCU98_14520 [Vibrio splendidus]